MDSWTHTIQVELGKSEQDQSSIPMSKYKLCYCATVSQNNIIEENGKMYVGSI